MHSARCCVLPYTAVLQSTPCRCQLSRPSTHHKPHLCITLIVTRRQYPESTSWKAPSLCTSIASYYTVAHRSSEGDQLCESVFSNAENPRAPASLLVLSLPSQVSQQPSVHAENQITSALRGLFVIYNESLCITLCGT